MDEWYRQELRAVYITLVPEDNNVKVMTLLMLVDDRLLIV